MRAGKQGEPTAAESLRATAELQCDHCSSGWLTLPLLLSYWPAPSLRLEIVFKKKLPQHQVSWVTGLEGFLSDATLCSS